MKPSLYLETTIPSYLTAWPSRDIVIAAHQQITAEWWRRRRQAFDVFISQFVLDEAAAGDPTAAKDRLASLVGIPMLPINPVVRRLADLLLQSGVVPAKAAADASHIAVSAVHRMDYLVTWNCAHLANATIFKSIRKVCEDDGFACPIICTPEELLEE